MRRRSEPLWKATAEIEESVERAVELYRHRLRRQALTCATESLHQWVARGVEWYQATCGWVFLLEPDGFTLSSIPEATVHSKRRHVRIRCDWWGTLAGHVLLAKRGAFANNIGREDRGRYSIDGETQSGLAVPLFDERGHEDGEPIGVYILEANYPNAFFPALVQELQKNVQMFTHQALVLQKWMNRRSPREPWIWHPDIHGWRPGRIAKRFCHAVVKGATRKGAIQPTCAIWNADLRRSRCWVLGTCGYDYEFQNHLALDLNDSATGRVARLDLGRYFRGRVEDAGFYYTNKADRMGVQQIYIGSLKDETREIFGTLNMYALSKSTILPGDRTMRWLCQQACDLLSDVYEQRKTLGIAYVNGQLAKAADPTPRPRIYRSALTRVLPCDAASLFVPEGSDLVAIDSTGFTDSNGNPIESIKNVRFPVAEKCAPQESITAHCFTSGKSVRINFRSERDSDVLGIPIPDPQFPEAMVYGDKDPWWNRRRLGVSVKNAEGASVGVIRLYRSSVGRPFTEPDEAFLQALVSTPRCSRLFQNWAVQRIPETERPRLDPDIPIPPSASIRDELQRVFRILNPAGAKDRRAAHLEIERAFLFVLRGDQYQEFVCHPSHELPPRMTAFTPSSEESKGIKLIHHQSTYRAWIRLLAWSGDHLMRTILAFDCAGLAAAEDILNDLNKQIHTVLIKITSRLTTNEFYPEPEFLTADKIIERFTRYVGSNISVPSESDDFVISINTPRNQQPASMTFERATCDRYDPRSTQAADRWCPEPDLKEFGVLISPDGSDCQIPLPTGTRPTHILTCTLHPDLAPRVADAMKAAKEYRHFPAPPPMRWQDDHEQTWSQLRRGVGNVVGAWARIVVPILDGYTGRSD